MLAGLLAGHGVHGAGACHAPCVLKQSSDIVTRASCSHLPSQQTGNSSSSTSSCLLQQRLLQQSVMHTTAAHSHTHAHAHTPINKGAREYTQTRIFSHAQTHRHTSAHTHTLLHAYAHTHTHTHTHSHAHMHMHAHVARVMGFANFSASLATLPHLSLCPLCECLLLAGIPSTPAPNSTLQHCYKFKKSLCPEAKVDRCKFRIAPFPCQSGCKLRTGPHAAPQNAEFSSIVNGLDIKSSILHSDEVEGALNWVSSLLALFGVAFAWG